MTLDELAATLPNGLHDAQMSNLSVDYVRREVALEINVWVGNLASKDSAVREAYRAGSLVFSGLLFCCIEPPDARYPYQSSGVVTIDTGTVESLDKPPQVQLPTELPAGTFTHWFFVNEWNAFIYVAATRAKLCWKDEAEPQTGVQAGPAESSDV